MTSREVLEKVKTGELSIEEAELYFKREPYNDLGFAKLDSHRIIRTGFPEVVYCEGKDNAYLLSIYEKLLEEDGAVFGTRAAKEQFEYLRDRLPSLEYDPVSKIMKIPGDQAKLSGCIAVCCAGTADIPVAEEAAQTAEFFGSFVERIYDVGVSGIHRLLSKAELLQKANCIIAVAGMEGALASVIGGLVANPVIAVPTSVGYGANFKGLSALLTMINSCANGIATVNINNGFGAGYIATEINRLAVNGERKVSGNNENPVS